MKKLLPWGNFVLAILAAIVLTYSFWAKPGTAPVAQLLILINIMCEMFIAGYNLNKLLNKEENK